MSRIAPQPPTLNVVPVVLAERDEEERRALLCASGRDPTAGADLRNAALAAALLLLAFVAVALLRAPH